jgi:hypothetical protein
LEWGFLIWAFSMVGTVRRWVISCISALADGIQRKGTGEFFSLELTFRGRFGKVGRKGNISFSQYHP